ncbi:MAG: hypothetical protein ABSH46_13450 [Bryobacteraceae bacterium]|jgi:hypothetical protein
MIKRLKRAIVESFVGAVALGWLFAQGVVHFANVFAAPLTGWIVRSEYRELTRSTAGPAGFSLVDALAELVRSISLLLVWYVLLRWLYYKPLKNETSDPGQNREQAA